MMHFIDLLDIVYSPPTFNDWIQLVVYGETSFLFLAKDIWRPIFNLTEIYALYVAAIGSATNIIDWLLVYIPITSKFTIRSLVYFIILSFPHITENEKTVRVGKAAKLLDHNRHLFSNSDFSSIIMTYLCDDCLNDYDDFLRIKYGFRNIIQYPIIINRCNIITQHQICSVVADLCCISTNLERIKAIFRIIEIDGPHLGEIIFRIGGQSISRGETVQPNCSPASIEPILKFLMMQYFCITRENLLPARYCSLENHVHDPKTFMYLLQIIDNPIIDIKANIRNLLWKTPTLEVMKEGFNMINYSMDLIIIFIPSMFLKDAPVIDDKFSWLVLQFKPAHIQRIYNIMNTKSLYKTGSGRRHFILKLIIHQKAIVRLVKLQQLRREMSARCKKFRVLHQLSLSPAGAFYDGFPGGDLYRNSMERLSQITATY